MLKQGDRAPEIALDDQHGKPFRLSSLVGQANVVLFFYPRANSAVCTLEACAFRDHYEEFVSRDTVVVGISVDAADEQFRFAQRWKLPFTLLSDPQEVASKAFGLGRWLGLLRHRVTFVIDRNGLIQNVVTGRFRSAHHMKAALRSLNDQRSL